MRINKGQVDQLWAKFHVNVYGMTYDDFLHGDPELIYTIVSLHRGKAVATGEELLAKDIQEAWLYFFTEGATGDGQQPSSTTGAPAPENS
jgi:hypothetical protein